MRTLTLSFTLSTLSALVLAGCGAGSSGSADDETAGGSAAAGLHASGSRILDANGKAVRLLGVNRSGTEYSCIQNKGFFDGPSDQASITAMMGWKANAVRVPLNEDCWLAINGAPAQYSGAAYQKAISDYVDLLLQNGIYPIVELQWSAPGTTQATGANPMPDQDHSITFWSQVAAAFASRGNVVLELFNEPYPDSNQDTTAAWKCWRDGGSCPGVSYPAAGMQDLVTAVRAAGAKNLVLLGGVQYSNALSHWVDYEPTDPEGNLAAAWHVYDFNDCNSTSCYEKGAASVVAKAPIVATEIGEQDCAGGFVTTLTGWLDQKGQSYLGWTWDTWGGCLVLVADYSGTPAGTYGRTYKAHLLATPH
ncbi:MAG: glycoside hydrolase family 5 protein [Polyangiaceae bacterium]